LDARLTTLFCRKIIVAKSKEVNPGCNLAQFSTENCVSEGAIVPLMMMVVVVMVMYVCIYIMQFVQMAHKKLKNKYLYLALTVGLLKYLKVYRAS
jgi:hypothetical protein